jgi:hypothetical protein
MKQPLKISADFSLPIELVTSTQAILARKRSGKSYCASVMAEELLSAHQQVVVIDPTSAWWGMKSSADGQSAGFPIVVFGGEHADVPLEANSGKFLARTVVEQCFSAIFDVSLLGVAEAIRFVADFATELFHANREAMHLFIDEADAYAPERPFGEETKSLAAIKRLVKQGGIRGIGVTMITQRPQQLAKSILSQVDILTVLRMSHPLDIKAATDWISSEVSPEFAAEVRPALPALPVGTAFVCSAPLNIGRRVAIRERKTFNSGATPKPGEKRVQPRVMAKVDLEKLGEQIKATVEKARANDPEALRKRIAELERRQPAAEPIVERVDKEALVAAQQAEINNILAITRKKMADLFVPRIEESIRNLELCRSLFLDEEKWNLRFLSQQAVEAIQKAVTTQPEKSVIVMPKLKPESEWPKPAKPLTNGSAPSDLTGPERRILNAIAWLESLGVESPEQPAVAFLAGYTYGGGAYNNPRGRLNVRGLVEYVPGDRIRLTGEGKAAAEHPSIPATNEALHGSVLSRLPGPEQRLLKPLLEAYPKPMANKDLAEAANYTPNAGAFNNPRGRLKTLGLIEYPQPGMVRAKDLLFPA